MTREPGTKVTETIDHGTRVVDGTEVSISELVWNGHAGSSFEVERASNGQTLTMDEAFDTMPDDDQIRYLLTAPRDEDGCIDLSGR
jgi:hypothetical protein